jgi:hypothetical protein
MMNTPNRDPDTDNPVVADIRARQKADRRASLSRKDCQLEGGWGQSTQIAKENQNLLRRYVDGSRIRITSQSFYEHLLALASAAPKKVRMPATRFARHRDPTPAELDGLKRGNEARAKEARRRREDKATVLAE